MISRHKFAQILEASKELRFLFMYFGTVDQLSINR